MRSKHSRGFDRATMSGDAWSCMKQMIGGNGKKYSRYYKWEKLFPKLTIEMDKKCRAAYMGGQNYSSNKGMNVADVLPLTHEDVHNMYGGVILYDRLPIGEPIYTEKKPRKDVLYIAQVSIRLTLKDGLMPWFQFKNGIDYMIEDWPMGTLVENCQNFHNLTLSCVDI